MKKIVLLLSLFLMIGCNPDHDNEKLILAKFIGVEQNENLMYPVFTNQVKHYAIDVNDPNTILLVQTIDENTEIFINGISQGLFESKFNLSGLNHEDTVHVVLRNDNSIEEFYLHCINDEIPKIKIQDLKSGVDKGFILMSSKYSNKNSPYTILFIIDNNGVPIYRKKISSYVSDFKQHPNGMYSYGFRTDKKNEFNYFMNQRVILDENFNEIKRIETKGLNNTDNHDFIITSEGSYILMSYNSTYRDFSKYGLSSNELTRDSVIQEISASGELIFEWNSWDYMNILDCLNHRFPDDYAHINSISLDFDENIIASFRGCSTILKINRSNGEVMWSLGGSNPSIKILGDEFSEFCGQHTATMHKGGLLTIFDNGGHCNGARENNFGLFSRALEYKIDLNKSTATFNYHYMLNNSRDYYTISGGSLYKTQNGNWLVNWSRGVNHGITEVVPYEDKIVFNIEILNDTEIINNYRAQRIYNLRLPIKIGSNTTYLNINE